MTNERDGIKALIMLELMKNGLNMDEANVRADQLLNQAQTGQTEVYMDEKTREATALTKAMINRADEHEYSQGIGQLNTDLTEYKQTLDRVKGTDLQESTEAAIAIIRRGEGFGSMLNEGETKALTEEFRKTGKWPTVRKSFGNQPQDHSVNIAGSR